MFPSARSVPGSFCAQARCLGHFVCIRLFDSILELCRTHRKRLYVLQEINQRRLQMKKYFFRKNWGRDKQLEVKGRFLVAKNQFFEESMKDRGSMCEHFPLCGSAWAAIWGRLLKKPFCTNIGFQKCWRFWTFPEGGFGRFRKDFCEFVGIVARNPDEKCCQGVN